MQDSKQEQSATEDSSENEPEELWEVDYIHSHQINKAKKKIFFRTHWKSTFTTPKDFYTNDYWNRMRKEIKATHRTPTNIEIEWRWSMLEPHNFSHASDVLKEYCQQNDINLSKFKNGKNCFE